MFGFMATIGAGHSLWSRGFPGWVRLSARGVPFRALSGGLRSHFNAVQRLCEATGVPIRRELPSDPDLSTTE